jgi:hypothetical protein
MNKNKTTPADVSVENYLAAIEDEGRRKDCQALVRLMTKASKHPPAMWGSSIVGFGSYHYKYESGREGDICLAGFSSRKAAIVLYGLTGAEESQELLSKLGKYKGGKGCLYINALADVDGKVLEQLVSCAVVEKKRQDSKAARK